MTVQEINQYFHFHQANIKLLETGFNHIRNQTKALYRSTNKQGNYVFALADTDPQKIAFRRIEISYFRILSGIQVSWAEECFKRILYEKNLFTDNQRYFLLTRSSLEQKWYQTLKIIFSIAYGLVPLGDEVCNTVNIQRERRNLGNELVEHYLEMKEIIDNHLAPNFRIRNKVQHGEWINAFEPPNSAVFSQAHTDTLRHENIITTTSRYTLVNAFYQMIVDMGRFQSNAFALDSIQTPFEYFYDRYIQKIRFEVTKINAPDLESYIREMIAREVRGKAHRLNNLNN